jgi:hypothetical protein
MKEKIKQIQHRMEHDPKFKEAVTRIKPKKNFWGIAGIILFFFVPELVTYIWQSELISWAHTHSITEPIASQRWIFSKLEEMFASGVSWFNLVLGSLFLWWVLK